MKRSETLNIGYELRKALTGEQIEMVLDELFASLDKQSLTRILSSLDEDDARKAALMLQRTVYSNRHDRDTVLGVFADLDKPEFSAWRRELLRQWQEYSMQHSGLSKSSNGWLVRSHVIW